MVPHLNTNILNCFYHLFWFCALTDSEFSFLAMLTTAYPVSCLAPMPLIPNLLHCIHQSAREVLGTTLGT